MVLAGTPGEVDSGYRFIVGADGGARNVLLRDGIEALTWTDPEPLDGGHVGLGCDGCRVLLRDCVIYPGTRSES